MKLAGKKPLDITWASGSAWPQPAFSSLKALKSQIRGRDQQTLDEAVAELGSKVRN